MDNAVYGSPEGDKVWVGAQVITHFSAREMEK
jgi:hypothetical protein